MGFAFLKEAHACPLAAIFRQQNTLTEIAEARRIQPSTGPGSAEFFAGFMPRLAGGHANGLPLRRAGRHHQGAGALRIGCKVARLMRRIAIVKIGPFAKDTNAQTGQRIQPRSERSAREGFEGQGGRGHGALLAEIAARRNHSVPAESAALSRAACRKAAKPSSTTALSRSRRIKTSRDCRSCPAGQAARRSGG